MQNGGSIVVNAEITFSDAGRDIAAMWVEMPDGTSFKFDESVAAATGTLTEDLTMPTNQLGEFLVEVWLVDESGERLRRRGTRYRSGPPCRSVCRR